MLRPLIARGGGEGEGGREGGREGEGIFHGNAVMMMMETMLRALITITFSYLTCDLSSSL